MSGRVWIEANMQSEHCMWWQLFVHSATVNIMDVALFMSHSVLYIVTRMQQCSKWKELMSKNSHEGNWVRGWFKCSHESSHSFPESIDSAAIYLECMSTLKECFLFLHVLYPGLINCFIIGTGVWTSGYKFIPLQICDNVLRFYAPYSAYTLYS